MKHINKLNEEIINFVDYLLLENRKDDLKKKYQKEFGDILGDELIEVDSTENNAYSDWLFKFVKNNREKIGLTDIINNYRSRPKKSDESDDVKKYEEELSKLEVLTKMLKKYDKNKQDYTKKIKDVKTIEELSSLLDEKRQLERLHDFDSDEVKIWFENFEWVVFQAYTYEVAQFANSRERDKKESAANWCTTYNEAHFENYYGNKGGILYCVNKLDFNDDVAFELIPMRQDVRIWNSDDDEIGEITKWNMKDQFEIDSDIYNSFKDEIEDGLETIEFSRDELEDKVRFWYEGMGDDMLHASDVVDYLDTNGFVDEWIGAEKDNYEEDFEEFAQMYENDLPDFVMLKVSNECKKELMMMFDITHLDDLKNSISDDDDHEITLGCLSTNGYERDFIDFALNIRYEDYSAKDIIGEFIQIENSSVADIEESFGSYFDIDDVIENHVDKIIKDSSDGELMDIIGDW